MFLLCSTEYFLYCIVKSKREQIRRLRLALPDSIISIKLDQITEKILHLFHSGMAGSLLHHIM